MFERLSMSVAAVPVDPAFLDTFPVEEEEKERPLQMPRTLVGVLQVVDEEGFGLWFDLYEDYLKPLQEAVRGLGLSEILPRASQGLDLYRDFLVLRREAA